MAYNTSKLVNLGQLKSALQTVKQAIVNARSTRTIVNIPAAGWTTYDASTHRYANVMSVVSYNQYNINLTSDSSQATGIMCANADIHAKIENGVINLYCYGTVPTEQFSIEVLTIPITNNAIGLAYDFGDDYSVYKDITDALDARVTELETDTPKMILFARNIALSTSRWTSSGLIDYPYKAVLNIPDVTENYFPMVQFEDTDVDAYDLSSNAVSGANTVTIYCKTKPTTAIIIPQVICYRGTFIVGT